MPNSTSSRIRVFRVELTPTAKVQGNISVQLVTAPGQTRRLKPEVVAVPDWESGVYTLVEFGRMLFGLVFPGQIGEEFEHARRKPGLVRLVIDVLIPTGMPDDINRLPWELLHDGQGWLAHDPNLSIARDPFGLEPRQPGKPIEFPLRVLALSAEPRSGFTPLFGATEHLELVSSQVASARHHIQLKAVSGATRETFDAELKGFKPHIVHYIGHAALTQDEARQGYLALELPGQQDGLAILTAAEFKSWLKAIGEEAPKLIVFMACNSGLPSRAGFLDMAQACLDAGVDATISMQAPLYASEALEMTRAFYSELATMKGLDEALRQARKNSPPGEQPRKVYFPGRFKPTSPFIAFHQHIDASLEPLPEVTDGAAAYLPAWMVPVLHVRSDADLPFPTPPLSITWPKDGQKMVYMPEAGLYVDSFPVTRGQYRQFASEERRQCPFQRCDISDLDRLRRHLGWSDEGQILDDLLPATSVTLDDALAYASWAGKHMPTLEEWQRIAAAGGDPSRTRPWVDGDHPERINCQEQGLHMAWPAAAAEHFDNRCPGIDIFDLVGNVTEWAYDPQGRQAYHCGGSFKERASLCTIHRAEYVNAGSTNNGVGFRCVASIDEYIQSLANRPGDIQEGV